jgi:hypothetical protein
MEDTPLAARVTTTRTTLVTESVQPPEIVPSSQPVPDTPPPTAISGGAAKSRGGRPTHKKKGRNQYSKDREARDEESPARSQSRDVQDNGSGNAKAATTEHHGKSHFKGKGGMNSKVSMSEMKRRVTAMFDYISKTQVELAGETPASLTPDNQSVKGNGVPLITVNGDDGEKTADKKSGPALQNGTQPSPSAEFKELSCVEMMDFLTRDLVHWQSQYAT